MSSRSVQRSRTSLAAKTAAAVAVAVGVLAGIWVSGGLITNDFGLAMALTGAWMALSGAGCALIAWRREELRVAVLAGYLVTVAASGTYLGRSQLVDDEVNEKVATVPPAPAQAQQAPGRPVNVELSRGRFKSVAHSAGGVATAIRRARGGRVLTLTSFEVDNGPDLRVLLVSGPARDESEVRDYVDLGALKGNRGDQQYSIPRGLDLDRYTTAVIWCRAFSVNFARAPLR